MNESNEGQVFIIVVVDGNNKFEDEYESLNKHIFMNLTNKENGRLLRKNSNFKMGST